MGRLPESRKKSNQKNIPSLKEDSLLVKWFPAFIFLFAILLYGNTLHHGFVMDDGAVLTDNATVQKGFAGIPDLFGQSSVFGSTGDNYGSYRPLTMSFFAMEKQFFGNNPAPFHAVHIFLYALCCAIVFLTLKELFRAFHPMLSAIASLLFVSHPLHTEVAANLKSADEILSLLLCFSSLFFSLKYIASSKIFHIAIAWVCFFAAMFSKESSITFLVVIPLSFFLFTDSGIRKLALISSLNLAAVIIYLAARNFALEEVPDNMPVIDNILVSAASFSEKFGTIFFFLYYYIRLLVFPHPLTWEYGYNQVPLASFSNPLSILSLLVHGALGIYGALVVVRNFPKKSSNSGQKVQNLFAFLILFYLTSLLLYTNIFAQIASNMAERFLFTPALAFCIALAILLLKISKFEIAGVRDGNKKILAGLMLMLLLPYSIKTFSRNKEWKTNLTLFAAGVDTSPGSYRAHSAYAWENLLAGEKEISEQKKKGFFMAAATHYQKALAIYDKIPADWYNFGVANGHLGKEDDAVKAYTRAVQMNNHPSASYNLGAIFLSRKDYSGSLKYYLLAYKGDSISTDAAFKIGLNYHYLNELQNAVSYYEKYYLRNPDNRDVINNLAIAYGALGNLEKKIFYQTRLSQLK